MLKSLRYALAAFCFAASVGCLGLWGWTVTHRERLLKASYVSTSSTLHLEAYDDVAFATFYQRNPVRTGFGWRFKTPLFTDAERKLFGIEIEQQGRFGVIGPAFTSPSGIPP